MQKGSARGKGESAGKGGKNETPEGKREEIMNKGDGKKKGKG